MPDPLRGRHTLVTGASRGIGAGIAEVVAAHAPVDLAQASSASAAVIHTGRLEFRP